MQEVLRVFSSFIVQLSMHWLSVNKHTRIDVGCNCAYQFSTHVHVHVHLYVVKERLGLVEGGGRDRGGRGGGKIVHFPPALSEYQRTIISQLPSTTVTFVGMVTTDVGQPFSERKREGGKRKAHTGI